MAKDIDDPTKTAQITLRVKAKIMEFLEEDAEYFEQTVPKVCSDIIETHYLGDTLEVYLAKNLKRKSR